MNSITDETTLDCGHKPSPHSEHTTGYGTQEVNGREVSFCYECAAERDREYMRETGRIALYLSGQTVTNWPGSLKFPVRHQRIGRHNIAGKRYDVWFQGPDGKEWHGVNYGDNTQICHCRRIKS